MVNLIAFRYAQVFYLEAKEKKVLELVSADFEALKKLLEISRDIKKKILNQQKIDYNTKLKILEKLIKKKLNPTTLYFFEFLKFKKRFSIISMVIHFFIEIKRKDEKILEVELIKSKGISKSFDQELMESLEKKYNQKIKLTITYDETLIGGFLLKIKNIFYDLSIKGKLLNYKKKLIKKYN